MLVNRASIENVNKELKLMRGVIKSLLGYLHNFDVNSETRPYKFDDLTIVDKMMMLRLLKFSKEITEAYESYDLNKVYKKLRDFVMVDVADFYIEFSKPRLLTRLGTQEYDSSV
jgi:isoleucyl-tRNA synthetase